MGKSPGRRRLFLYEGLLPVHQLTLQQISDDAFENWPERQPGDVLGARKIRSQAPRDQNGQQSAATQHEYGRGPWWSLRPLRLFARDCFRLRIYFDAAPFDANGPPGMSF